MNFSGGFVQVRRGIIDHVWDGRISFNGFGVHEAILLLADKATGSWCGSAPALHTIVHIPERTAQHCLEQLENAEGQYILRDFTPGKRGNYPILINKYLLTVGQFKGWRVNIEATKRYYGIPFGQLDVLKRKDLKQMISSACQHPVLEPCTEDAEELVSKLRERGVEAAWVLLGGGVVSIPRYADTSKADSSIASNEWMDDCADAAEAAGAAAQSEETGSASSENGTGVSVQPGSEAPDATPGSALPLHAEWVSVFGTSIAATFSQLLGKTVAESEADKLISIFQRSGLSVADFGDFLEFAVVRNDYSAKYLRVAGDPVASLERNLDKLLPRYEGDQAASQARIEAAAKRKAEYSGTRPLSEMQKVAILAKFQTFCDEGLSEADFGYLGDPSAYEVVQWFTEINGQGRVSEMIDSNQPEAVSFENFDDFASFYPYVRTAFIRNAESPVRLPHYDGLPTCPDCKTVKQRSGHVCDPKALEYAKLPLAERMRKAFEVEGDE